MYEQEKRYRETVDKNRKNGQKGGKPRRNEEPEEASETDRFKNGTEETDRLENGTGETDRKPTQTQTKTQIQTKTQTRKKEDANAHTSEEETCSAEDREEGTDVPKKESESAGNAPNTGATRSLHALCFTEEQEAFRKFKAAYPKTWGLTQSFPIFTEALRKVSPEELMEALEKYRHSEDWRKENGRYVPCAEKWLREESWKTVPKPCFEDRYVCLNLSEEA